MRGDKKEFLGKPKDRIKKGKTNKQKNTKH